MGNVTFNFEFDVFLLLSRRIFVEFFRFFQFLNWKFHLKQVFPFNYFIFKFISFKIILPCIFIMNEANEMSQDGKVNVKIPLACHFSLMNEFMTAVEKPSKFFFCFFTFQFLKLYDWRILCWCDARDGNLWGLRGFIWVLKGSFWDKFW